jgi:hypothetical protein
MRPKLYVFLTWIFYLAQQRTSDEMWFICMIYSAVLAVCALFYQRENKTKKPAKKAKA